MHAHISSHNRRRDLPARRSVRGGGRPRRRPGRLSAVLPSRHAYTHEALSLLGGIHLAHNLAEDTLNFGTDCTPVSVYLHTLDRFSKKQWSAHQTDDQAVEAERLSENEDEDHHYIHRGLLRRSAHTRVSHNANGESGSEAAKADARDETLIL